MYSPSSKEMFEEELLKIQNNKPFPGEKKYSFLNV